MTRAQIPWCGAPACDRRTRLIHCIPDPNDPSRDFVMRCELCHEFGGKATGCGKHIQPPQFETCSLCSAGVRGRNEPPKPEVVRPESLRPEQLAARPDAA